MGLLPENNADRIAWFTSRTDLWNTNHTAIGVSTTNITAVTTAAAAATDALAAQIAAQNAAKAATETLNNAMVTLTNLGNVVIEQVRTQARLTGDSVYPLANIPAPATPTPVGELGKPSDFTVALQETGELQLGWKCTNPQGATGTFYMLWRKIGSGTFECLGGCGSEKKFLDSTVPAGSASVTYKIQATRSGSLGPWAQFVVNFGVDMGQTTIQSIVETPAAKIAA